MMARLLFQPQVNGWRGTTYVSDDDQREKEEEKKIHNNDSEVKKVVSDEGKNIKSI